MKIQILRRYQPEIATNYFMSSPTTGSYVTSPNRLLQELNSRYSSNRHVIKNGTTDYTVSNMARQYSFLWRNVSNDNRVVPWNYSKFFKPEKNAGTKWEQAKRKGLIVVTPHFRGYTSLTYTPGILELKKELTGLSNGANAFSTGGQNLVPGFTNDYFPPPNAAPKYPGPFNFRYQDAQCQVDYHPVFDGSFKESSFHELFFVPVESGVVTEALAKAEDGIYDILTEFAELPETLRYLTGTVAKAADISKNYEKKRLKLLKEFRKGKIKTIERLTKALASLWLQYRYAIMPLVYSAQDVAKLLKEMKRTFAKYNTKEAGVPFDVPPFKGWTFEGTSEATLRCFIKRSYDPNDLIDALLSSLKINPFATAYELTPLSFVVDWFINIGEIITAFTGSAQFKQQAATFSSLVEINGRYLHADTGATVSVQCKHYNRTVINPSAHIGLSFNLDLNWKRQLDAFALLLNPSLKVLKSLR